MTRIPLDKSKRRIIPFKEEPVESVVKAAVEIVPDPVGEAVPLTYTDRLKQRLDAPFMKAVNTMVDKHGTRQTAAVLGVPETTLWNWRNGRTYPTEDRKKKMFQRVQTFLKTGQIDSKIVPALPEKQPEYVYVDVPVPPSGLDAPAPGLDTPESVARLIKSLGLPEADLVKVAEMLAEAGRKDREAKKNGS
jgi:hypothetical protein